ncbi:MAG TPA: hypothetical protein VF467_10715 [Afipia sp.]
MTDRIDVGSFDRASLSPSDYAALKVRIARQAHAARTKAIAAAFRRLMHYAFKYRYLPTKQSIAKRVGARRSASHPVRAS